MGLIASVGNALLMAPLLTGDFFNAYPYQDEDSFDWITQGLAFVQLITGTDTTPWPILRKPVFVLLSALDVELGMRGIAFLLTQSFAAGLTTFLLAEIHATARVFDARSFNGCLRLVLFRPRFLQTLDLQRSARLGADDGKCSTPLGGA